MTRQFLVREGSQKLLFNTISIMKEKIYSIGIDVSKKTLDVCFMAINQGIIDQFKIDNSPSGIEMMIKKIEKSKREKEMRCVMESTGSYHILSALLLKGKGYSVKVFNPILSSKYAQNSIRKCKTDKIDAQRIAQIGIFEKLQEFETTKEMFLLKKKISLLQKLTKEKQVMSASLKQFEEDYQKLSANTDKSFSFAKMSLDHLEKTIKQLEKEIEEEGENMQ